MVILASAHLGSEAGDVPEARGHEYIYPCIDRSDTYVISNK